MIFDYKERILKFIICINILLLVLVVFKILFTKNNNSLEDDSIVTSLIELQTDTTNIYVEYPRFSNNDEINKTITDILYSYVKDFKNVDGNKSLNITYNVYYIGNYINITFKIQNSLNNINNKNIIIDTSNNKVSYISSIYNKSYLQYVINKIAYDKYPKEIYDKIKDENINNFTYIIDDEKIEVYFNNITFESINYVQYVIINIEENNIVTN